MVIGGSAYASGQSRPGLASLRGDGASECGTRVPGWLRSVAVVAAVARVRRAGGVLGRRLRRRVVEHDHDRARHAIAPVTTVAGGSDTCPGFHGSTTSITSSGPTAPAFLIDATAGAQGCLDVVTFTFQTRGDGTPPGYTVGYQDQTKQPFQDGDPPPTSRCRAAATLAVQHRAGGEHRHQRARQPAADVHRQPVARLRRPPPPGDRARAARREGRRRSGDGELGDRARLAAAVPRRPGREPAGAPW